MTGQMVPSLDLGIVILTNGGPVGIPEAVNAEFLDLVQFAQINRDWVTDFDHAFAGLHSPEGDLVGETPPANAAESVNLESYTGSYYSEHFGQLTITKKGDTLVGALGPNGGYTFELTPWDTDTFSFVPTGENAPAVSLSSARFERTSGHVSQVTLNFFDRFGLGTWERALQ